MGRGPPGGWRRVRALAQCADASPSILANLQAAAGMLHAGTPFFHHWRVNLLDYFRISPLVDYNRVLTEYLWLCVAGVSTAGRRSWPA